MPTETRTLEIPVFRCNDGLPTCGIDDDHKCPLIRGIPHFGTAWCCSFNMEPIWRDDNGLRPSPSCPLWKGEV